MKRKISEPLQAKSTLVGLPAGHPYAQAVDGTWRPARLTAGAWEAIRGPVMVALALDIARNGPRTQDVTTTRGRRNELVRYMAWLADNEPELLHTSPFDTDEINRYLAVSESMKQRTHRSRTAVKSTLLSFAPDRANAKPAEPKNSNAPISDDLFNAARQEAKLIRSIETRHSTLAVLALGRGCGLMAKDMRYVTGDHIEAKPYAGTWVHVTTPNAERSVPVLARFAGDLKRVAAARGSRPLIAHNGKAPTSPTVPQVLTWNLTLRLRRSGLSGALVNTGMLRKAWLAEQLESNAPLKLLMDAGGVSSLRCLEELLTRFAPEPGNMSDARHARLLGGRR